MFVRFFKRKKNQNKRRGSQRVVFNITENGIPFQDPVITVFKSVRYTSTLSVMWPEFFVAEQ